MYEELLALDVIKIRFSPAGMHAINIVLSLVMFGVALGIRPDIFKDILKKPKSFIIGLLSQVVMLPMVTFIFVVMMHNYITPMVAMGMMLVAACPGGNISNFISQLAKGNTELSVSLTAVNTSASIFLTPFNFAFWGGMYVNYINHNAEKALRTLNIDITQLFITVIILLGIPLLLGILTSRYLPKLAKKLLKPMQYLSIVFFIIMVVLAFNNNLDLFLDYIFYIFIIVLVHNMIALSTGYGIASAFNLPKIDRRTITIETGIQNSGLGLVLLFNPKIFPQDLAIGGMLFITAWWGIWHIISGLSLSYLFAKNKIQ